MSNSEQTSVIAVLDDMFFASKIKEAAKQLALGIKVVKNVEALNASAMTSIPKLIIVDLNSNKIDPISLITDVKSNSKLHNVTTLGYLPHVEKELGQRAIEAGYDIVMPRSRFVRELGQILVKYA
ncbi:MAG: hypothetical protein AAF462_08365 [Thermodesulfobacteriota bacterium]